MKVVEMLRNGESIDKIAAALDSMDHAGRLREIYAFNGKDQALLYQISTGRFCDYEYFAPVKRAGQPVVHWGINSLPLFSKFQKIATAFKEGKEVHYSGYNEQPMKAVTGPGYYNLLVVQDGPHGLKQLVIDYTGVQTRRLPQWPEILPNSARLSRFIYNMTRDWMWKVSSHVSIGRASRDGQWLDNWFLLCRED